MKKTVFLLAFILPVCTLFAQLPPPVIPLAGNISDVDQDGLFNSADVSQNGDYNWSTVNTAGVGNGESFVDQTGSMNTSTVLQIGLGNSVDVTQKNDPGQTTDENLNYSWITQFGMGNKATVDQEHVQFGVGPDGTLEAYVLQTGIGNESDQAQKGMQDVAIVVQSGIGGEAVQKQGNTPLAGGEAYASYAAIVQLPMAFDSKAEQHQTGKWNVAGIIQGEGKHTAQQLQVSRSHVDPSNIPLDLPNVAGIIQVDGSMMFRNTASQAQYYDGTSEYGNWAGAYQQGGGNMSNQTQVGGNNLSGVSQVGGGNAANVVQTNGPTVPSSPW